MDGDAQSAPFEKRLGELGGRERGADSAERLAGNEVHDVWQLRPCDGVYWVCY